MELTINVKPEVYKFLQQYHPKPIKAETHDEMGWMVLTILTNSFNRSRYELQFEENGIMVRSGNVHPKFNYSETITVEIANWRLKNIRREKMDCESINVFNNYCRNLLLRTFIKYMIVEVDVNKVFITDAIHNFQEFYDLSEDEFSTETCKRFWQRHKNDASPHRIGLNADNSIKTRRRAVKSRELISA